MLLCLLISTETHSSVPADKAMQAVLMREFFKNLEDTTISYLSLDKKDRDLCSWRGLTCVEGFITEMVYKFMFRNNSQQLLHGKPRDFDMAFIPPTVQNLRIQSCVQHGYLDTRNFPREARYIDLNYNHFRGVLDLTALPVHLEDFRCAGNSLIGPISLTQLPQSLHSLFIETNLIQQRVVYYGNIPPGMNTISLRGVGMQIKELRGLHPEDSERGRNLFNCEGVRIL